MTRPRLSKWSLAPLTLLLAGCATAIPAPTVPAPPKRPTAERTTPPPMRAAPPPPAVFRIPEVQRDPGLEGVIQHNAASLRSQFGPPRLDVREGDMRKLQWSGPACLLDVFLYPLQAGAEPVATYLEARRASDGQDVDKAACVAALVKR
ncbi:MAG: hypothetical protein ABIT09_02790 [Croceibacterium sp.]